MPLSGTNTYETRQKVARSKNTKNMGANPKQDGKESAPNATDLVAEDA
jgi:hypothetical protein